MALINGSGNNSNSDIRNTVRKKIVISQCSDSALIENYLISQLCIISIKQYSPFLEVG